MKTRIYKNIDLVRIPIKAGVGEYFFPQNVAWADKKVDEVIVCAPTAACIDPVDGTTAVMTSANIQDLFFNLYAADDTELTHDMSFEQIAMQNNNRLDVRSKLNLSLSKLYFTSAPVSNYTLLIYVAYDSKEVDDYDVPTRSRTVQFPMSANEEISLREIMSTYIHNIPSQLKGLMVWDAETEPAYLTLRDYELTYNVRELHTEMCRPDMNTGSLADSQAQPMWFNNLNIDFDYSHIRNAQNAAVTQTITFLY